MEALLASGADLHAAATDDTNSLHFAAQKGHLDVAKLLLAKGSFAIVCLLRIDLISQSHADNSGFTCRRRKCEEQDSKGDVCTALCGRWR